VVFLTTFTDTKGLAVDYDNHQLSVTSEGKIKKFIQQIDQISFSGEVAREKQKEVLYVTERCVFRLSPNGLELSEIAPGIDLEKDILSQMEYQPLVAEIVAIMDRDYFRI
jgi:propionate CoA-transferase